MYLPTIKATAHLPPDSLKFEKFVFTTETRTLNGNCLWNHKNAIFSFNLSEGATFLTHFGFQEALIN